MDGPGRLKVLDLVDALAEDEHVFLTRFLHHLNVGAVQRADRQRPVDLRRTEVVWDDNGHTP